MDASTDIVWRSAANSPNPFRCWHGEYVVYNTLSGDTHVLDVVTGEVLKSVVEAPSATSEISRHLATFLEVPDDAAIAETVGKILNHLDELGLIEPVGGC